MRRHAGFDQEEGRLPLAHRLLGPAPVRFLGPAPVRFRGEAPAGRHTG